MFEKQDKTLIEVEMNNDGLNYFIKDSWKVLLPQKNADFHFTRSGKLNRIKSWFGIEISQVSVRLAFINTIGYKLYSPYFKLLTLGFQKSINS